MESVSTSGLKGKTYDSAKKLDEANRYNPDKGFWPNYGKRDNESTSQPHHNSSIADYKASSDAKQYNENIPSRYEREIKER